ncbi:MAG: hypothetical protein U0800_24720 [Isosphaeraceae bacterium]
MLDRVGRPDGKFRESVLKEIDQAVEYGGKHQVHVMINFHRAPGYTVAQQKEERTSGPTNRSSKSAPDHWATFAKRYQGIPTNGSASTCSTNRLRSRPTPTRRWSPGWPRRSASGPQPPDRLRRPRLGPQAADRAGRPRHRRRHEGYDPFHLTHYQASWVNGADKWPVPAYPLVGGGKTWDRSTLEKEMIAPWKALQNQGVGVMVGEFGSHNRTPHEGRPTHEARDCPGRLEGR